MNITAKIVNLDNRDYHMHSMNFSDGFNTVDEIVKFAWEIWMTEIAITDHSDKAMEFLRSKYFLMPNSMRSMAKKWRNVHNDVNVIFWVEADILDEDWNICDTIVWKESDFIILSAHSDVYSSSKETVNKAYENAIKKHHQKIKCICHPCSTPNFGDYVDIEKLVDLANQYDIALEMNAKYLYNNLENIEKLHILLQKANKIYINSDSHCLFDLKEFRKNAINFLKENNYI